jgi:flagellar motor switch protein FliG
MTQSPRSTRKAAILLASLDPAHAQALLEQMSPAQAAALREAVDRLGPIDAHEQDAVIEEFFRIGPLLPEDDRAGVELDAALPESMAARLSPGSPLSDCAARMSAPFQSLDDVPAAKFAALLARESAQTIAVVISHLGPQRAAEVFGGLSASLQTDVARRLVDLGPSDPEVLREIEHGLDSWLRAELEAEGRRSAGVAALSNILGAATPEARHEILANLARHDRQLASRLEPPAAVQAPSFVDLERMDSASLAAVFDAADAELLPLALAGAAPRFAERAMKILGAQRAAALHAAMCNLGPTPLADIEEAQLQLAEVAQRLEARGRISPQLQGRFSVAV